MLKFYSFSTQKINLFRMKKLLIVLLLVGGFQMQAQSTADLLKHYEAYYKQMQAQGDVQGMINAMTPFKCIGAISSKKRYFGLCLYE